MLAGDIIAIIALLAVIGFQGWMNWAQRNDFKEKERQFLDRIMATNYQSFIQGETLREQVKKSLTNEEIYEMNQERGIPV